MYLRCSTCAIPATVMAARTGLMVLHFSMKYVVEDV